MRILILLLISGVLSGCAIGPQVRADVSAMAAIERAQPGTFMIDTPNRAIDKGSLEFQAVADAIATSLAARGYKRVELAAEPQILVLADYSISDPIPVASSYTIPIWGQTGVSASSTYGTFYGNSYSAQTTYTPTYGVTGYNTGTRTDLVYVRSLVVRGIDFRSFLAGNSKEIWKTQVLSRGPSPYLHEVLPYLLQAGSPYFATNVGVVKDIRIPVQ